MSSSHERVRLTEQLQTATPEVPQRPVRGLIPPTVVSQSHHPQRPQPAVREIHKNAWLKRVSPNEKKGTSFIRKGEKLWVVFCVHDDVEAFLEFYPDPKVGATHKPVYNVSLNSCQHVSSSIVGQDNEFQFAVTLPTQVIRLFAANWDQMMEWVESLQGKLREMNILSPKDNLYSKLPESRINNGFNSTNPLSYGGLVSTRDPNSPLPPPPNGFVLSDSSHPTQPGPASVSALPVARGTQEEPSVYLEATAALPLAERQVGGGGCRRGCIFSSNFNAIQAAPAISRSDSSPASSSSSSASNDSAGTTASFYVKASSSRDTSGSDSGNGSGGSIISLDPPRINCIGTSPHSSSSSSILSIPPPRRHEDAIDLITLTPPSVAVVVGNSNTTVVQVGGDEPTLLQSFANTTTLPVQVQQLAIRSQSSAVRLVETATQSRSLTESSPSNPATTSTPALYSVVNKHNQPQSTSRATRTTTQAPSCNTNINGKPPPSSSKTITTISNSENFAKPSLTTPAAPVHSVTALERQLSSPAAPQSEQINPQITSTAENIYEHIFLPETTIHLHTKSQPSITSASVSDTEAAPPTIPKRNPLPRKHQKMNNRSSSLTRLEEPSPVSTGRTNNSREGGSSNQSTGNNRNRSNRQDVIRQLTGNGNPVDDPHGSTQLPGLEGRPMEAMIGVRSGEYRIRREEISGGQGDNPSENSSSSGSSTNTTNSTTNGSGPSTQIPLKEQQVARLKSEINHAGGVRVVLRKKDCVGSIAFIDYLGAVWIAGWKQHEHPVLYYAFHVGDQVLKVAGVTVQNSVEAYRAIKMVSSMQVEFIMRRLPFGRVFVLKRSREGEPLGLVAVGSSAEIGEVLPNGLAASQGLPLKSPATDGKTTCNWFLTEVNNRPLSLMARESEVRDRLNAVGKEISILVQPSDLVKHLRKQLKSIRGFKDYLIV